VAGLTACFQDLLRFEFFGDSFADLLPGEKDNLRKKALRRFFDKQARAMASQQHRHATEQTKAIQ
jgi:hypothetical protein